MTSTSRGPAQPAQPAQPGWGPDPWGAAPLRWWDGFRWTEHTSEPMVTRRRRSTRVLGGAVRYLLVVCLLIALAQMALELWGFATVRASMVSVNLVRLATYDTLHRVLMIVFYVALALNAVAWPTWQFRLAKEAPPFSLQRSAGMHAGSWFIPVVLLWFPLQNVRDLWRVRFGRPPVLLGCWWAAWVLLNMLDQIADTVRTSANSLADFQAVTLWGVAAAAVTGTAALLALLVVRRLTEPLPGAAPVAVTPATSPAAW